MAPNDATVRSALLAVPVIGLLASCIDPTLPEGAQVSCESELGCPPGMECATALGRCVVESQDKDPPSLASDAVLTPSPAIGKEDTEFTLEITATDPLGRVPEVVPVVGASGDSPGVRLPPFVLESPEDGEDGERRTYRFSYVVAGVEPNGVATIIVTLVDEVGNSADVSAGTFTIDLVRPRVLASELLAGRFAKADTLVDVSISFDEDIADAFVFIRGDFPGENHSFTYRDGDVYTYRVTGQESEGLKPILVVAVDAAGNFGAGGEAGDGAIELPLAFELDFTPPQVTGSGFDPTPAGANDLIEVTIEFTERLVDTIDVPAPIVTDRVPYANAVLRGGDPTLDVISMDVRHDVVTVDGVERTVLSLQHRVRDCDVNGTYDVVLDRVIDRAGNEVNGVRDGWQIVIAGLVCE